MTKLITHFNGVTQTKKWTKVLVITCSLGYGTLAYAGWPVFDYMAFGQRITELQHWVELLKQTKEQIDTAKSQLENAKSQLSSITGSYGWGDFMNSEHDLTQSQFTPNNWSEALKGIAGGDNQRYQDLLSAYKKAHPVVTDNQYRLRNTEAETKAFNNRVNTVNAVAATAQTTYANINEYLKVNHDLSKQIDSAQNKNIKSAMDLNTRMAANNANLLAAMIRLQAVQTNLQTEQAQMMIQSNSEQQQFMSLDQ